MRSNALDNNIKTAVIRLQDEIRAMGAKAERDLEKTWDLIQKQFAEMRQEISDVRSDCKALREEVHVLHHKVDRVDTKLNVLLWVVGGLGTLITIVISAGRVLHWFEAVPAAP